MTGFPVFPGSKLIITINRYKLTYIFIKHNMNLYANPVGIVQNYERIRTQVVLIQF